MSELTPQDDWKLDSLNIEFQKFGENKGKYTGSIRFSNGDCESFAFRIRPNMTDNYINLIADDIVKAVDLSTERLVASLQLRARPKQ